MSVVIKTEVLAPSLFGENRAFILTVFDASATVDIAKQIQNITAIRRAPNMNGT
jgi:hypothetical protein